MSREVKYTHQGPISVNGERSFSLMTNNLILTIFFQSFLLRTLLRVFFLVNIKDLTEDLMTRTAKCSMLCYKSALPGVIPKQMFYKIKTNTKYRESQLT